MKIKYFISGLLFIMFFTVCNNGKNKYIPVSEATSDSESFYQYLYAIMDKGIMLGHQDAFAFGNMWYGGYDRSDMKSTCGDHPAIIGWNLNQIETGAILNTDSVYFEDIIKHIQKSNSEGKVSVIRWSPQLPNYLTYSGTNKDLVASILPGNENHKEYLQSLNKLADFFKSLKDDNGKSIPVIFKLFNNYNQNDLWWGNQYYSPDQYVRLWTSTVDYFRKQQKIDNVLYEYSVYAPLSSKDLSDSYPGNDYADIIGIDIFMNMDEDTDGNIYKRNLDASLFLVTNFAEKNRKIPVISNTGLKGVKIPNYFTNLVYPIISKYKISYIMFEKNAWNIDGYYFIPIPGHPASEDFKYFAKLPNILTSNKF